MGIADNTPQKGYCIYAHLNLINDKVYIGISKDVKNRWAGKEEAYKHSPAIYNAFKKYGWDNFAHIVMWDGMTKEEACKLERANIFMFKFAGMSYNIADGGEGVSGTEYSDERREAIRERMKNRIITPEFKQKCKESQRKTHGKKVYAFDINTKQLIKEYNSINGAAEELGTSYCCIKRAASGKVPSAKGYIWSFTPIIDKENPKYNSIKYTHGTIYCYDLQGRFLRTFSGTAEAAKVIKGGTSAILRCCTKKILTYKGYIWRFGKEKIADTVLERIKNRKYNKDNEAVKI